MSLSIEEKALLGRLEVMTDDDEAEMLEVLSRLEDHIETRGPVVEA